MKQRSFLSQFVSLGFGSFIYLLVGLIGTPIITRLVDPASYGDFSIFSVYCNLGLSLLVLGLDQSFVRFFYVNESAQYRSSLLYACMVPSIYVTLALGSCLLLGASITNKLFFSSFSMINLSLLVLGVIFNVINRYSTLTARLLGHTNLYSSMGIVQKSLFLLLSISGVLLFQSHFPIILILATLISTLLSSLLGILKNADLWLNFKQRSEAVRIEKKELLDYGLPLLLSASITILFNTLDKLALDQFCTRTDVGVYTSAMNLLAVFSIIRASFNALWIPSAVAHYEQNPEDTTFFQNGNAFISILMLLFGAAMIMCKDLFVLLLGEDYRSASAIFPFLIFEPIMYTISETTVTGLVVKKKSSYQIIVALVSCATNFLGNWILTPVLGPKGAAISTGFSYIVFFTVRTYLSAKVYRIPFKLWKIALLTILLALFAVYASSHSFSLGHTLFFLLYALVVLCIYFYEFKEACTYAKQLFFLPSGTNPNSI